MRYLRSTSIARSCWSNGLLSSQVEQCMQSHLKTFAASLAALDRPSKVIAAKLTLVDTHESAIPDVSLTLWYWIAPCSAKAVP